MGNSPGLEAGNTCHLRYFLIAAKSPQLCAASLAHIGLWNDKALQDVSGKSALTPPAAFYGPEGEGVRSRLPTLLLLLLPPLIELCVCEHIPFAWMRVGARVFACARVRARQRRGGKRLLSSGPYIKTQGRLVSDLHALLCVNGNQRFPPTPLRFSADAGVRGATDRAGVDWPVGWTSDKRRSVSSCGGSVMM